ncbi:HWE histidine kinase domain-containing protein [Gluconacetobacter takamatsuzukensis]|uniref:histidine kinase n=1 Tax=Gluconacetobacter takamatsuzukensis TaxID=1286190 RepID=A0A7W4KBJ4_9PROT|nr:HWE histidine kinase domain-containing protein [Gluconacetobacter takamatsuzukensis]MBB2203914.1 GAF domain-containing protein [Gluconacetobacter takamatsuzukensis]
MTGKDGEQTVFGQADLTNCDREPIHIPASIQPTGCVMVFAENGRSLVRFSRNVADFMKRSALRLGMSLEECVGQDAAARILTLAGTEDTTSPEIAFDVAFPGHQRRDIAVHRAADTIIIEFEDATPPQLHARLSVRQRRLLECARDPEDLLSMLRDVAVSMRQMFGYDRVMVYRFAPDWSGQVIVEDRRDDLESFLGQHFPSSDIPAQARELYRRSPIRVIGDAHYQAVPLIEKPGIAPLDMSFMHLRAVSPIHCEYLLNMGVHASMSVSLIVDGRLWGLIACHHYSPRVLFMAERIAAKMIGAFIGLQTVSLHRSQRLSLSQAAHRFLSRFLHDMPDTLDLLPRAREHLPGLPEIISCDGSGVLTDQGWVSVGLALSEADVRTLVAHAGTAASNQIWQSEWLARDCPALPPSDLCGAMIIPFSPEQDDCLVLFRREMVQTVVWGGDPAKTYSTGPHGIRLTPHRSFEIWTEEVRHQSSIWSASDCELASLFRSELVEIAARSSWMKLQESLIADRTQRIVNDELNHRVKNVLAVVGSLLGRLPPQQTSAADYRESIQGRIQALANAHDLAVGTTTDASLRHLLATETAPYASGEGKIVLTGPDIRLTEKALTPLALLFHELTTNAAKYGALSTPSGRLSVRWTHDALSGTCAIQWQERDGPLVQTPHRSGFGSLLIDRAISHDLQGTTRRSFDPEGVYVEISLPAATVMVVPADADRPPAPSQKPVPAASGRPQDLLRDRNILILEDEFLIAADLEYTLQSQIQAHAFIAPDIRTALDLLKTQTIDLALLDMNVQGVTSTPVAADLAARGIPFAFATGYGKEKSLSPSFSDVPILEKPYAPAEAVSILAALMTEHA